jgi:hypothetical protein
MFRRRFTVNNLSLSTVQASFAVLLRVVERRIKVQSQPVPLVAESTILIVVHKRPFWICV